MKSDKPERIKLGAIDYMKEVFVETKSLTKARKSESGLNWYLVDNVAFGFSDKEEINLSSGID